MIHSALIKKSAGYAGSINYGGNSSAKCEITNSIFADLDHTFYTGTTNFQSKNSIYYDMPGGLISGQITAEGVNDLNAQSNCTGNISADPEFADPANGDFSTGTICRDAGISQNVLLPSFDFYGNSRSSGSHPDIGPIEYQDSQADPPPITVIFQSGVSPDSSYAGTTDNHLTSVQDPNYNLGSMDYLQFYRDSGPESEYRILIRFDISAIPENAVIVDAQIQLYRSLVDYGNTGFPVSAYRITRAWDEGTGAWHGDSVLGSSWLNANTQTPWTNPGGDFDPTPLDNITIPSDNTSAWFPWNITSAVQAWHLNSQPNNGIILIISDPNASWTSEHQFYSRNYNQDPSLRPKLVVTYQIDSGPDITPPPAPTNLSASTDTSSITLSWSNPNVSDFAGIRILRKSDVFPQNINDGIMIYEGTGPSFIDNTAVNGVTYFYGLFSFDEVPNYSSPATISITTGEDNIAPAPVTSLSATSANEQISLTWANPQDSDLANIRILYKTTGYPENENDGSLVYNGLSESFIISNLTNGTIYYIAVFAIDETGNVGPAATITASPSLPGIDQVTGLSAFFRSGQTFITWNEVSALSGESYRIYRHTAPITSGNISTLTPVAVISEGSGYFIYETERTGSPIGQTRFIIQDQNVNGLGQQLQEGKGLFVYTNHENNTANFYYAVTAVNSLNEENLAINSENVLLTPIVEEEMEPRPVCVWLGNSGRSRVYTQFMDYYNWNPNYEGYAYNFMVQVPNDYDNNPNRVFPVFLHMEGHGSRYSPTNSDFYGIPSIYIRADDNRQTWYYGFGSNALANGYQNGIVKNYTEYRLIKSIQFVLSGSSYRADPNRVYAFGHSMGASGALTLGLRFPSIFAAIYASEP
ncbi:MAG: DNRLRE domain-containing protein, partial [Chlamydiota bacterium]|nr:DNRLRE domain-containing protein [Chlamydiota bacterium]